jgi:hypothetical protein
MESSIESMIRKMIPFPPPLLPGRKSEGWTFRSAAFWGLTNADLRVAPLMALIIQLGLQSTSLGQTPCLDSAPSDQQTYEDHIVELDSDGRLKCGTHLDELFAKIAKQNRKRIILYIHGGRISLEHARRKAVHTAQVIQCDDPQAYPIFLNWEGGQGTSYLRHLAYERNGISYKDSSTAPIAIIASPLVFLSDLGRGASRLPINTWISIGSLLQNWDALVGQRDHFFPVKRRFDKRLAEFVKGPKKPGSGWIRELYKTGFSYPARPGDDIPLCVYMGKDARLNKIGFAANYVLTLPLQFGTEPVLDTFGTPAWGDMVRRTRSMFNTNFISVHRDESSCAREAGAKLFFHDLDDFMERHGESGFTLDVYAHSMGTMIMNQAFEQCPDLHVHKLVYMAAACSIRDFQRTAARHIEKHRTQFYNLSLHPRAELDEVEVNGIPVRGSLLVWIDEFFNRSESFEDRTLGIFENAIIAQDLLPKGLNVHLKTFPMEDRETKEGHVAGPQRHNDFGNYYFWQDDFCSMQQGDHCYRQMPKKPNRDRTTHRL